MSGPGAIARAVALVPAATQQVAAAGTSGYWCGLVVRETSAAALVLRVWDGPVGTGILIDIVSLAANGVDRTLGTRPVFFANGVIIERVSGTNYEGSARVA